MIIQKPKYYIKAKNKMTLADKAVEKDIKKEGLHIKHEWQIAKMLTAHVNKIPKVEKDLWDRLEYPDWRRKELKDQLSSNFSDYELLDKIEEELKSEIDYYTNKNETLNNVSGLLSEELRLRIEEKVDRAPIGTTYYVDFTNGSDANTGLGTTSGLAWATLDKFTESTRNDGDICIVRGGMTQTVISDLTFSSDGDIDNPIVMKRDYGDEWSDHANSTQTYTPIFGSKTMEASATISGISAGDWIYNTTDGDDPEEFAYEVASVSGTTLTLQLPFKGSTGSTKTLKNMGSSPIWNIAAGNYQWNFDGDYYWKLQGLHIRGTDLNGVVELDNAIGLAFIDCIFEGNGAGDIGIKRNDAPIEFYCRKCRFYNYTNAVGSSSGTGWGIGTYTDCLFDGNSAASSKAISYDHSVVDTLIECELKNHAGADIQIGNYCSKVKLRNCVLNSTNKILYENVTAFAEVWTEDYNGEPGDTRYLGYNASASGVPVFQSETTKVRSGGSNKSIKITPSTNINSHWDFGKIKILDIPIYATTASKTYTVYFASDTTTEWTTNPTAGELWIEFEAWGHASNNHRKITKSTGTVDFKTDTDFDQSLAVTVAPAQAGVGYLRVYYAKPKEAADTNIFYVDPIPVIS